MKESSREGQQKQKKRESQETKDGREEVEKRKRNCWVTKELSQGEPRISLTVEIFRSFEGFIREQGRAYRCTCWKEKGPKDSNPLHDFGKSLPTLLGLLLPRLQTQYDSQVRSNPLWLIKYSPSRNRKKLLEADLSYSDSHSKILWKRALSLHVADCVVGLVGSHATSKFSK